MPLKPQVVPLPSPRLKRKQPNTLCIIPDIPPPLCVMNPWDARHCGGGSALSPSSGPEKAGHLGSLLVAHGLGLLILTMGTATWTRSVESANGVGRCHHVTVISPSTPPSLSPLSGASKASFSGGRELGSGTRSPPFPVRDATIRAGSPQRGAFRRLAFSFLGFSEPEPRVP